MMNEFLRTIEKFRSYIFLALLIAIYLFLDFETILFLRPQGLHFIRQTDSLSFVANYYKNGFHFFNPQVFSLQSHDGRAACEFPILYYLTAILYLVFNEHEFILRLITILIASTGFFYLFKLLYSFLNDFISATGLCCLLILSPVVLYYTNNFLPDASALGLTLTGWYFFFSYVRQRNKSHALYLCFFLFCLASLLKVTFFINPITAILSLLFYDLFDKKRLNALIRNNVRPMLMFFLSLLIVLAWNIYVDYYNKINHDNYFLIRSMPLWGLKKNEIALVWQHITVYWSPYFYYRRIFQVFILIVMVSFFFFKRFDKTIFIPTVILTIGSICYFLLFFAQFKDHDYYFIALVPAIIFILVNSFVTLKNLFPGLIRTAAARLIIILLFILSIHYERKQLLHRYQNSDDQFAMIGRKLSGTKEYMDSLGISRNAKIVIITDQTPNGGLYFIDRPGWNLKDTSDVSKEVLTNYINQDADYLLFTSKDHLIKNLNGIKAGEQNGILIYKISQGHL